MQARAIRQRGFKAEHIACDLTDDVAQQRAFERHVERCGGLDYAVLNAGIGERGARRTHPPQINPPLKNSFQARMRSTVRQVELNPV